MVKTYVDYFLPFEQLRGMLLGVMWARDRAQPGSIEELDDKIKELQAEYDHRKNLPDPDKKEIDLG